MEGKKKRWRPSLGAYRELQREIDEQVEMKSVLVADCDAWRDKYRLLKDECTVLERSNELMKAELDRVRMQNESFVKKCSELERENRSLLSRGFWSRVFNTK